MSPMISSLYTGGDRKNLGWELGGRVWIFSVTLVWALVTLSRLLSLLWTSWLPQRGLSVK